MGDVNLKDYFKNFEDKLLVKMPKQEEADITSATRLLEGGCFPQICMETCVKLTLPTDARSNTLIKRKERNGRSRTCSNCPERRVSNAYGITATENRGARHGLKF